MHSNRISYHLHLVGFMKNILIISSLALGSMLLSSCGLITLATLPIKVAGDVAEGSYKAVKTVGKMALPSGTEQ